MIYTITFNPSLDYIMNVECFEEGKTNRSRSETIFPGGKGFNVSTILSRLDMDNIALGFVAGFTGDYIELALKERQVKAQLIHLNEGMSRINVKIKGDKETEINGNGPMISNEACQQLFTQLEKLSRDDYLILAGSIPSSLPSDIYSIILEKVSNKGVTCIVDASGDLLKKVFKYQPFLIKPNLDELEDLYQCKVRDKNHLIELMMALQEQGAKNVMVSLGKNGAVLLDENQQFYYQSAFEGVLVNSVGSGDSMIAGFVANYIKKKNYQEALCFACACGSATAFSQDLATKEEIYSIFNREND